MTYDDKILRFIPVADSIAQLSKDKSTKVGAVALGPKYDVRAVGYNGFPRGCADDVEARHARPEKYFWSEHAERNLVYNAARHGVPLEGCVILLSGLYPCMDCARAIVQAGFVSVYAPAPIPHPTWDDHFRRAAELFHECGVNVFILPN